MPWLVCIDNCFTFCGVISGGRRFPWVIQVYFASGLWPFRFRQKWGSAWPEWTSFLLITVTLSTVRPVWSHADPMAVSPYTTLCQCAICLNREKWRAFVLLFYQVMRKKRKQFIWNIYLFKYVSPVSSNAKSSDTWHSSAHMRRYICIYFPPTLQFFTAASFPESSFVENWTTLESSVWEFENIGLPV